MTEPSTGSAPRRSFHLKARIGAGAFGEVYLAEQDSGAGFTRPVALKVLNENAVSSREAARRMRDEARILGRLSHRNIVSVLDLVRLGERWGVVMDYVEGADVEQIEMALFDAHELMPAPAALEIGAAIGRALDAAWHASDGRGGTLQVVHRDIKPSNVRVTRDGEVKVLDFGVARVELETREAETRAQGWIGTERYMAPERILNEGDGPWGDVYAAGASVIEMILLDPLGRTPVLPERHQPLVEKAIAQVRERLNGPEPVLDEVCEVLAASVHNNPQMRPTARDFADKLDSLARRLEGETLSEFCRRFLPRVDAILGNTSESVTGVLSEGTGSATAALAGAADTFLASEEDEEPRSRKGLLLGLGAGIAVVGLGLALVAGIAITLGATWAFAPTADTGVVVEGGEETVEPVGAGRTDGAADEGSSDDGVADEGGAEGSSTSEVGDTDAAVDTDAAPDEVPVDGTPETPKPEPTVRPSGTASGTSTAPSDASTEGSTPSGPPVSAAVFSVRDASSLTVTCGGVSKSGTASVRMRNFPSGRCSIVAIYGGDRVETAVEVTRRQEVMCQVEAGGLSCGG